MAERAKVMDSKVTKHEERQGLASIVGKWKDFEEVKVQIDDLARLRKDAGCRKPDNPVWQSHVSVKGK